MHLRHVFLGIVIAIVWGCNFIFLHMAVQEIPPITLCAIRFFFSAIPLVFFVSRPKCQVRWLFLYSLFTFALQFSLMFLGIRAGISAGLASLLAQTQVFFSFFLATVVLRERLNAWQILGASFALVGVGVVFEHLDGQDINLSGFLLLLGAAFMWGVGNLCVKKMVEKQGIGLVAWSSLIAFPMLLAVSYIVDGPNASLNALQTLSWRGLFAVMYIVYISTWVGYGLWGRLLSLYPVSLVVPFTLLVPVIGLLASNMACKEQISSWKLIATGFILTGLMIHLFGGRLLPRLVSLFRFRVGQQGV